VALCRIFPFLNSISACALLLGSGGADGRAWQTALTTSSKANFAPQEGIGYHFTLETTVLNVSNDVAKDGVLIGI
jgi:hypothetical protein